jgi:hypothetical protein
MSKNSRSILPILAAFFVILQFFARASGQSVQATIRIDPGQGTVVQTSGKIRTKSRNLSFLRALAGAGKLGERVSEVSLFDAGGSPVTYKKFVAGEYVADSEFSTWSYTIDLTPPSNRTGAANVSWLTTRGGILMLDDLLPQFAAKDGRVTLDVPSGWRAFSQNRRAPGNEFETNDVSKSVIFVGRDLLEMPFSALGTQMSIFLDGEWNFTSSEAVAATKEVYSEYWKLFGSSPQNEIYIAVLRFPSTVAVGNWEADTRGSTVTILSSDMPFKSQSLQRLHEQLRHEMFHLWVPNGVNLTGQYDWFYEGFALYRSLKLGVAVNRIRFDDFLDTLSRAYDIDRLSAQRLSLIDASKTRWAGANTRVYARGMLVAFLCDLAMLDASKGKRSTDNLLSEIYEKHRPPAAANDANAAILALMRSRTELLPIAERYVSGSEPLDWAPFLQKSGIEAATRDQLTRLAVVAKPSGRQKDLLDKLGYNSWRKLANSKQ